MQQQVVDRISLRTAPRMNHLAHVQSKHSLGRTDSCLLCASASSLFSRIVLDPSDLRYRSEISGESDHPTAGHPSLGGSAERDQNMRCGDLARRVQQRQVHISQLLACPILEEKLMILSRAWLS